MTGREFVVREEILVRAPIERCFALSTHVAVVEMVLAMRPVAGRMTGSVVGGDTVRWRGWKWGLLHEHESLIDAYEPPVFFRDRMLAGRFARFEHEHNFAERGDGTVLMHDDLCFSLPWRMGGETVGRTIVLPHIHGLMRRRYALIKNMAEGEGWRRYRETETKVMAGGSERG
jgi:ligand-binding SRPBCC domain-containing protein